MCLKKYHILPITGVLIVLERDYLYPPRCKDRPRQGGYLPNPPHFLADLISGMHLKCSLYRDSSYLSKHYHTLFVMKLRIFFLFILGGR